MAMLSYGPASTVLAVHMIRHITDEISARCRSILNKILYIICGMVVVGRLRTRPLWVIFS